MPQPLYGAAELTNISGLLTNIGLAFMQDQTKYKAASVFPTVPVSLQAGRFNVMNKGDWFRAGQSTRRAPATETPGIGWTETTATYYCDVYGVHKDLDSQTLANAVPPRDPRRNATRLVTNQILLDREVLFVSSFLRTGVWATDLTGVAASPGSGQFQQWDQAGSTPIEQIHQHCEDVERLTGYRPNTLVLGPAVKRALVNHAEILDRIKYTQRGIVTDDLLAALFEVDQVVTMRAIKNDAAEGAADAMDFVFDKAALLVYAAANPSLEEPSGGYIFVWNGLEGSQSGYRVRNFPIPELDAERVEGEFAYDMHVMAPDLGIFLASAVA